MMGAFSLWHWLVVLLVVILVFGTKRLRGVGGDLGAALRSFRDNLRSEDPEEQPDNQAQPALETNQVPKSTEVHGHSSNQRQ